MDPVVRYMYDRKYGDRDPVAQPGTESGTPGDWEPVFALVPDVFEHAVRGFALYQSPDRLLSPLLRELAQARVGWACGSQFVYSQHCKMLRQSGASEQQVADLPHWTVSEAYSHLERAVLSYADCIAFDHGRVPDELFAALQRSLSDEEILELTYITALYAMHAVMSRALRTEFDDRAEPVTEVPAPEGYAPRPRPPFRLPPRDPKP
ncbi:carboxymuconolactone decarboxylase family protein [Actinomadura rugatobispora]|uniref:Carboxymuconolactone decarboxylase family protein n=1 Tax=Actinomadura rugatobispora TaxID=1994 RepID=A0ABW0ZU02_9ACTN|nr:carboxymuconolactone decarboxylase family protein [Actinomadura rugatobispora]